MRVERLSGDLFEPAIEVWRGQLEPGQGSGKRAYAYEGEEVVLCEEGELTFDIGGEEHVLTAGDTLHFKAGIAHRWWNSGSRAARARTPRMTSLRPGEGRRSRRPWMVRQVTSTSAPSGGT